MIRNYFKLALRNMMKYKFFSAVNILGMSIGIAACLLILLYVVDELSFDRFHPNADRIYQVGLHGKIGGQDIMVANTCPPMAEALVREVPAVKQATRIANFWGAPILKYGDKSFTEEKIFHADSNFFYFFGYKLLEGDPKTALLEPNTVVLTRHIAQKYFGNEEPLGKLITVGGEQTYKVTGVAEDAPLNSHFIFNVLLSSRSVEQLERTQWLNNFLYTYFLLDDKASLASVEEKFKDFVVKYVGPEVEKFMGVSIRELEAGGGAYGYFTTPVTDIHLRAKSRDGLEPGGNIIYVYVFGGVGIFIILIACINFMNLSTARSAGRAKEVGLRKTLGSLRSQMIGQFLAESVVYSFVAVIIALLICYLVLPQFNLLSGKQLGMSVFLRPFFVGAILLLIIVIGAVSGSYPAFYLTSFNVVEVLKGRVRAGMKSKGVRSTLVVFQFALSIFLIIFTAIVYQQIRYMQAHDLGIDKHNVLVLPNAGRLGDHKTAFKDAILQQTGIVSASFSDHHFPGVNNTTVFKAAGSEQDHIMGLYYADYDQQRVLKFELKEGRYFSRDFPSDSTAIILNEAAVKEFGFTHPLQEEILFNDEKPERLRVIGVIRDFNFESMKTEIRPLAIRLTNDSYVLTLRYEGNPADAVARVERVWREQMPGEPFDYSFLDDNFDQLFRAEQRVGRLFTIFSGLAIFIACLGLFALAAFMAEQRTKEIGIRKAMGATTAGLTLMLSREFTRLVIIAFVPAAVAAWFAVESWLSDFAYRIHADPLIFAGSGLVATAIAWFTVGFQSFKAAAANPVNSLRYE